MFLRKIKILGNSLLFRLTILYTLTFTLLAIISFSVFYYQIYSVTMERMDEELMEETAYYSEYLARLGLVSLKKKLIEETASENPEEEFYRLIDFKGNVLDASDMSPWNPVDKTAIVEEFKNSKISYKFRTITQPEEDHKARMISAVIGPDTILQKGESLEEAREYLEIFRNLFSILTGFLITASAIIGWYLAKRALTDMADVTQAAEEIAQGSYDRRVEIKGRYREIERLGTTFNKMLDRIQILLRSMKEINDNIAHDLRSPLARIRGIAEMTLMDEKSINDYKEMAINTIEECDSLIDMINTMLDITEAEAGVNGTTDEDFDVVSIVSDACELFRPIADQNGIELTYSLPEALPFQGSKKKMQRIVTNILENAIKYTPEQGTVAVSATAKNGKIQIIFNDTGVGISADDLPHIFERFYRCDRSRPQDGVGLGLCLAKAYTEAMNGFINVTSAVNKGSTFTLSFGQ
jgi:signal transduction histidine kinase